MQSPAALVSAWPLELSPDEHVQNQSWVRKSFRQAASLLKGIGWLKMTLCVLHADSPTLWGYKV
jgi:hypothetical protein